MNIVDVEENLFVTSDAKLHGDMCKKLSAIYCKIMSIFPSLEAARPRSKFGIQALCSVHVALEKTKNVLQHCSECSKLCLPCNSCIILTMQVITGDSVLTKFEKARCALQDGLRCVDDIVPQSIGYQVLVVISLTPYDCFFFFFSFRIFEIVSVLEVTIFAIDPLEKQAATKLGITSSKAALAERRALKKLIERARAKEDKRNESIVAYLLHLMTKYSKLLLEMNSPMTMIHNVLDLVLLQLDLKFDFSIFVG
ncbi:hypothetical protein UlMin_039127 [Ulmus minor]